MSASSRRRPEPVGPPGARARRALTDARKSASVRPAPPASGGDRTDRSAAPRRSPRRVRRARPSAPSWPCSQPSRRAPRETARRRSSSSRTARCGPIADGLVRRPPERCGAPASCTRPSRPRGRPGRETRTIDVGLRIHARPVADAGTRSRAGGRARRRSEPAGPGCWRRCTSPGSSRRAAAARRALNERRDEPDREHADVAVPERREHLARRVPSCRRPARRRGGRSPLAGARRVEHAEALVEPVVDLRAVPRASGSSESASRIFFLSVVKSWSTLTLSLKVTIATRCSGFIRAARTPGRPQGHRHTACPSCSRRRRSRARPRSSPPCEPWRDSDRFETGPPFSVTDDLRPLAAASAAGSVRMYARSGYVTPPRLDDVDRSAAPAAAPTHTAAAAAASATRSAALIADAALRGAARAGRSKKRPAGRSTPRFSNLFRNVGRSPVAARVPTTTRSAVICSILYVKSSWSVITSDSMRCTSVIEVTRRLPSSRRSICTIRSSADEICWRIARSGIS